MTLENGAEFSEPSAEKRVAEHGFGALAQISSPARLGEDSILARARIAPDPADSHYELPIRVNDDDDAWQADLPAPEPESVGSADNLPAVSDALAHGEIAIVNRRYLTFIDSWGQYHFGIALGFGVLSIVMLGFSLFRAVFGAQTVILPVKALVTGGVALVVFSFLLVAATALNLILVDLARNVRR